MRVRLLKIYASPRLTAAPGTIIDLERAEAYGLLTGGYAEQVDDVDEQPIETAMAKPAPERAVARGRGRR
jgi:hypothetical protein